MATPEILGCYTLRQATKAGIATGEVPHGANGASLWTSECVSFAVTVFEKTSWNRTLVWDGAEWLNTDAHYIARRFIEAQRAIAVALGGL